MAANQTNTELDGAIGSGVSPLSGGNMLEMLFGLIVVVAVILVCAWLYRRVGGMQGGIGGVIKVVAGMSLGSRDRIALIEVGEQKILLGISPGRISTLHVFDEDPLQADQSAMRVSQGNAAAKEIGNGVSSSTAQNFAGKLQSLLNKQDGNDA